MKDIFLTTYANNIYKNRYSLDGAEKWADTCKRVIENVTGQYLSNEDKQVIHDYMLARKFIPAGRYLYGSGREFHNVKNCFAFKAEDTREGWGELLNKVAVTSMTGGGCGVVYSNLRPSGAIIKRTGGVSSGPIPLIHAVNETCRYIKQGGSRRAALWAGLSWSHKDIFNYMRIKNWDESLVALKDINPDTNMPLELTNISVIYDTDFFVAMERGNHPLHSHAKSVWEANCLQAFASGEPGFCFNFLKDSEDLRNPCSEFLTDTDSDSCNLGTIFINAFSDRDDFQRCVKYATMFLICGNLYSNYPTPRMKDVAMLGNRIGLGIGGIHEWMIRRGFEYEVTPELHKWLSVYKDESDSSAYIFAKDIGVPIPKAKRAIAPNGTISALAETTSGIEPLFCKAYKRKYDNNGTWVYEYVIDGAIKKLINEKIDISKIQDAYDVEFKQRVKVQADIQRYIDMAISSTCNLPEWGGEKNNATTLKEYSKQLLKYAKKLRGFTCYPDGARKGQPLERVDLNEALKQEGKVFEYKEDHCASGSCSL